MPPMLPFTGCMAEEEHEIGKLVDELELAQIQLTQNPLRQILSKVLQPAASGAAWDLENNEEEVTEAKVAAIEVFAGVVFFIKLQHRFISWKAQMVAQAANKATEGIGVTQWTHT